MNDFQVHNTYSTECVTRLQKEIRLNKSINNIIVNLLLIHNNNIFFLQNKQIQGLIKCISIFISIFCLSSLCIGDDLYLFILMDYYFIKETSSFIYQIRINNIAFFTTYVCVCVAFHFIYHKSLQSYCECKNHVIRFYFLIQLKICFCIKWPLYSQGVCNLENCSDTRAHWKRMGKVKR